MNIINSDIVEAKHDLFWDEISDLTADAVPKTVLVLTAGIVPGSPEETQFQKMLEACKLIPGQYNVVRFDGNRQAAWHKLREAYDPQIIFLVGVLPLQLGIHALFQINAPNNFDDRTWLPTYPIHELENNAGLKKQLWMNGMKPVFVDKER